MYTLTIDDDIPLAEFAPTFESLDARVAAALSALHDTNSIPFDISDEAAETSRAIFTGQQTASDIDLSKPEVITHLGALLQEYDHLVVKSAAQLRTYITNKLILESANPDPRIRLKSLEMLGKISDVGLFTDKTEITMRHRPTEELEQLLRERLTRGVEGEAFEPARKPAADIQFSMAEITGAHT